MAGHRSTLVGTHAPRRLRLVAALGLVAAALSGCTPTADDMPDPTPPPAATATPTDPAAPSPSPTPSAEDVEPAPEPVELTGAGVGTVPDGTPDALGAVEDLLGPAESFEASPFADCGAPWISTASWGPVDVTFNEGALFGWQLSGTGPVPPTVALPHDIQVGDPFGEAMALPGAPAPELFDNYQVFVVSLDGVQWWADDDAPESPVTVIGHNIVGCG